MVFTMLVNNLMKPIYSCCIAKVQAASKPTHNGFGSRYNWAASFEEAVLEATEKNKPIMLIVHKPWCKMCSHLKTDFSEDEEIFELSRYFVMLNMLNDEPRVENMSPDGNYVPRILFLNSDGLIDHEIYNDRGHPNYKFFYTNAVNIIHAMKLARNKYYPQTFEDSNSEESA